MRTMTRRGRSGGLGAADLADQCRRHHNGVTHGGFGVRHPAPGVVEWTTPTGHRYTVEAEPVPATTWWPTVPAVCPCDACDAPKCCESDIADALAPGEEVDDLNAVDLLAMTVASVI